MQNLRYFLLSSAFAFIGCSGSDITSPNDIVFPATNVSFKAQVEPLFSISCNINGCHDMARPSNNDVDLTSWIGARSINVVNSPGPADTTCGLLQVVFGREFHPGININ